MFYFTLIFITLPTLSFVLNETIYTRISSYIRLTAFLFVKKIKKTAAPWSFTFKYNGQFFSIQLFEGSTDVAALKEIFIDGEYEWDGISAPQTIVDLGAHTGNTALYFHIKYPNAMIYAVEASPRTFTRLLRNVSATPNIKPIFGAISDKDGSLSFYESESSLGSSVINRGNAKMVQVPCFTLPTLFKQLQLTHVDLMKIDIEGAESSLFTNGQTPDNFSFNYMIEVHQDLLEDKNDFTEKYFHKFITERRQLEHPHRYLLYAHVVT